MLSLEKNYGKIMKEIKMEINKFKEWVKELSIVELVVLQHDLRKYKEDRKFLYIVLEEIKNRTLMNDSTSSR